MKKRFPLLSKTFSTPLLLLVFLFITAITPACNNSGNSKEKKSEASMSVSARESMNVDCIRITSDMVKIAWVDPGWTRPGDANYIVWLKFITTSAAGADFNVTAYGAKADTTTVPTSGVPLIPDASCTASMPSGINYGPNFIRLSQLDILNTDGSLKTFDYIRLTPQVSSDASYANFAVEVVTSAGAEAKGSTVPCPPPSLCPSF